jgi:drug/metabolite transporter (DMT)-like permease
MTQDHDQNAIDQEKSTLNITGLLNLVVIYIVWGSTYLAIRIAVREGAGFPPFMMGGTRVTLAGLVLLLWSLLRGKQLKPTRTELKSFIISAVLLWVGGNGLVSWAEQRADSGLAALLFSAIPIWAAIITTIIDKQLPTLRMVGALALGFLGMGILSIPVLQSGIRADLLSVGGLLLAGLSWGTGSVIQGRYPIQMPAETSAAWQQLLGGLGLFGIALLRNEPLPTPTTEAWFAWGYLLVFGSILAFTSFVRALKLLPTKIVMTYPYVNPVIAVFLGWLILDERISVWTFGGAVLILLGVAGVFRERYRENEVGV